MAKKENHMGFMSKLLSFGSDKDLKRYYKIVDQINGCLLYTSRCV